MCMGDGILLIVDTGWVMMKSWSAILGGHRRRDGATDWFSSGFSRVTHALNGLTNWRIINISDARNGLDGGYNKLIKFLRFIWQNLSD